jgi:hypothetical protein
MIFFELFQKKENEKKIQVLVPSPANVSMSHTSEEIKDQLGVQLRCWY